MDWTVSLKDSFKSSTSIPVNVTLFGNGVSANAVKLRILKYILNLRWVLNSVAKCPYKEKGERERREVPWGWEGMRGSHFENQACGRGQEGGKARSQLQSVGWQGRLDSWAGWNAGEQSLSFFLSPLRPRAPFSLLWLLHGLFSAGGCTSMRQLKAPKA